ncbi:MAG: ribosomal protein S18-alanine N-acetyltransferase [Limnochordia bacterium]|jgi:ribosomal-protein-alanine N-acetyltransferase
MVSDYQIRPMRVRDVDQVVAIEREAFPIPWSRFTYVSEIVHNDRAHYFVAVDEDRVLGYAGMWLIAGEGHITNVAVAAPYRRQGIGTKLLRTLAETARGYGALRLTLEVRRSNEEAQGAYKKCGFLSVGVRPGYYLDNGEDAVIMWKDLMEEVVYGG